MAALVEPPIRLFPGPRFAYWIAAGIAFFLAGFFSEIALLGAYLYALVLAGAIGREVYVLIFRGKVSGQRTCEGRFSNGDDNAVHLHIFSTYPLALRAEVIDELPPAFQRRDFVIRARLLPQAPWTQSYLLRPLSRGIYGFGRLQVMVNGPFGLFARKFTCAEPQDIAVYPSFVQMRKYQLLAAGNRLSQAGVRKIRRLGHTTEFEQIRDYVQGDDLRTMNWKATGRKAHLMVNQYRDERQQHIYCLIDKSRTMALPFEGMSLLDYAINTTLVLANIALYRQDKAGLCTFAEKVTHFLPATSRPGHLEVLLETLYHQDTGFLEADYDRLYAFLTQRIPHRSLLVLFANFETFAGMKRQWPALAQLAKRHLLVVIFFENTELTHLTNIAPKKLEDIYLKAIGEQFIFEKRRIVRELEMLGIHAVLTTPQNLTVSALNTYLALKARGLV